MNNASRVGRCACTSQIMTINAHIMHVYMRWPNVWPVRTSYRASPCTHIIVRRNACSKLHACPLCSSHHYALTNLAWHVHVREEDVSSSIALARGVGARPRVRTHARVCARMCSSSGQNPCIFVIVRMFAGSAQGAFDVERGQTKAARWRLLNSCLFVFLLWGR